MNRIAAAAVLLALVSSASVAFAGDKALAESLFQQGKAELEAGHYAVACPKLAESYRQDPATGTLLALAVCQDKSGKSATAWATYAEVAGRAKRNDRKQAARARMKALGPTLSHLTITVAKSTAAVPGLVIKLDGDPVGQGAWGTPAPVDPGKHVVVATAPGKKPWTGTVTVKANADNESLQVPALEDAAKAAAASTPPPAAGAAAPTPASAPPTKDHATSSGGSPLRTIGIVVGAAGVVTLGASGYFALHAKSLDSASKKNNHCDANNTCDPTGLAKRHDAVSAANVATVTLVAGGVLTAAGVTLFILGKPKSVEAAPAVGPHQAGLLVRGRF